MDNKWKNIERGGYLTIKEAQVARTELLAQYNASPEDFNKKATEITLGEIYNLFIEKEAQYDREKSTLKRYSALFRNHLEPKWGIRNISTIKATELTDYFFSMSATLSYAYIQSIHKFTKVLWKFAVSREYIKTNVIENVILPLEGVEEGEIKIYTQEQLDILEERFKTTNLLPAYKIGRTLGTRCGEPFGLCYSDIDWDKHTIRINKQLVFEDNIWTLRNTKTKASIRTIDLQDDIYDYLKQLKEEQEKQKIELGNKYKDTKVAVDRGRTKEQEICVNLDFINVKPDGALLTPDSAKVLARIAKSELDIHFKYHNLRHSHASWLAEHNVPLVVVKARLGHSKEETTQRYYTHQTDGMRLNLLNTLNAG